MRIGLDLDSYRQTEDIVTRTTNYSKAEFNSAIKLDITNHGKDTDFVLDQGRSIKEVMDEAGALDVQTTQDMMTVMSNTMSEEDYKKMCDDGFDPSDMEPGEAVTIVDHIKAVMAESGMVVAGYNDEMDSAKLEEITGSVADAGRLARAMKEADVPQTKENAKSIWDAADELEAVDSLSDSSIKYMIDRHMDPTIENLYMARHSVADTKNDNINGYYSAGMQGYLVKKAEITDSENLEEQIEKTVDNLNIDDIDKDTQIKEAKWLVTNGIDVNSENLLRYHTLSKLSFPVSKEEAISIAADAIGDGKSAKKALYDNKRNSIYRQASDILNKTKEIKDEDINRVISRGKEVNLKNLWSSDTVNEDLARDEGSFLTAKRNLEEVRLRMTLDVNVRMIKMGIAVDTMSLSDLVDTLKVQENTLRTTMFGEGSEEELGVKATNFRNTRNAIEEIPFLPAATIGRLRIEESTLKDVVDIGTDLRQRYESAKESYEELMTAPRSDMGDSINKAFRNIDDILQSIGLETSDENRKAVRILGYNSMVINEQEIDRIKEACNRVENVVKEMTPGRTLEIIRQGINPMNMSLDELSKTLKNIEASKDSSLKYSRFLYKLEKSDSITESEKEAYIGLYRFVNRLEKTDYASVGALVNGQNNITFGNLLSGMRSKKAKFNVSIDDNFGMLTDTIKKGVSITDQIEQAFREQIGEEKNKELERQYREEQADDFRNVMSDNKEVVDSLTKADIEVNYNNLLGASLLRSKENNVFCKAYKYETQIKEEISYEEDSLLDMIDGLEESFTDEESLQKGYNSLLERIKDTVSDMTEYISDTSIDLKALSLCNKQISVASRYTLSDNYVVPFMTEDGLQTMHLKIQHDSEESGTVTATLYMEKTGEITAYFKKEKNGLSGMISSEKKEGLDFCSHIADAMNERYGETSKISAVTGKQNPNNGSRKGKISEDSADINSVDTKELINVAKTFLIAFKKA